MTVELEFESIRLHTRRGEEAAYQFSPKLNLIVGPFGSGKTSLLELLKYGLGGGAELSQTVESEVSAVVVGCKVGTTTWRFRREIGSAAVEVFDLAGTLETTLHSRGAGNRLRPSEWLLAAAGLPPLRVRRARRTKSGASELISFFDFYAYAYLPQAEIDRSIVDHRDRNRDRKRKAVFDVMFGLRDETLSALEVEEGQVAERIQRLQREREAIQRFLEQASTPPRETLRVAIESAKADIEVARARLARLRTDARDSAAQESERRREASALVGATQALRSRLSALEIQIEERRRLDASLTLDIERHSRSRSAAMALSGLDFTRCPRCLQAVEVNRTEAAHCYLCGQPEVDLQPEVASRDETEIVRLKTLRREVRELLTGNETQRRSLVFELELLEQQLIAEEAVLGEADATAVEPLFDAITAASSEITEAQNRHHRAEELMRYWNELDRLDADLRELQNDQAGLLRQVSDLKAQLEQRRGRVSDFSATFREIVAESQLPWFEDAAIDLTTYMPVINGASFDALSSGGMKAVVNVAYHLALLTEGLVDRSLRIPNLLIIDSPAKNLGVSKNDRSQADRVYRRIAALVGAYERSFQIIVADNDPPGVAVPIANRIELSYESPLVPGVTHPGPDVPTIGNGADGL